MRRANLDGDIIFGQRVNLGGNKIQRIPAARTFGRQRNMGGEEIPAAKKFGRGRNSAAEKLERQENFIWAAENQATGTFGW